MKKILLFAGLLLCVGQLLAEENFSHVRFGVMTENFSLQKRLSSLSMKTIFLNYHFTAEHAIGMTLGITNAHLENPFAEWENHFNGKNVFHLDIDYLHYFPLTEGIQLFCNAGPTLIISGTEDFTLTAREQSNDINNDFEFTWGANAGVGLDIKITRALHLLVDYNTAYKHNAVYHLSDYVTDYDYESGVSTSFNAMADITQTELISIVRIGLALGF